MRSKKAEPAQDEYLISYINALKKEQNCASIAHSFLQNAKEFLEVLNKPFSTLACVLLSFWLTLPLFFMVERIWNLPNCYLNYSLRADYFTNELLQIDRVMPCDKNVYFTFGSFSNLSKMNEHVVALWSKILKAVPNSKLFLKYRQLNYDEQKEHFCRRLLYLRANMREYIKDKPVFNTASFARDVEAMRMWSEFISRIPK